MPTYPLTDTTQIPIQVGTDFALTLAADVDNPVEGDLNLRNGTLYFVSNLAEQVQQGINIRARHFYGEWFLDTTQGMLWFERVFVKGASRATLNSMFRQLLLSVPGVASIRKLTFGVPTIVRNMLVTFEVVLNDGTIHAGDFKPFILQDLGP